MYNIRRVKIFLIIGGLLGIIGLYGCSADKPKETAGQHFYQEFDTKMEGDTHYLDADSNQPYLSYGLVNKQGDITDEGSTITLDADEEFFKFLNIKNGLGFECNYTLVVLDNYAQIPFQADDKEMEQCTVTIPDGKDIQIPVKISSFAEGQHSLTFLLFVDTKLDNPKLYLTDDTHLHPGSSDVALTYTLVSKSDQQFIPKTNDLDTVDAKSNSIANCISITQEKPYKLTAANVTSARADFALILLDDYTQVPLLDNDKTIYLSLDAGEAVSLSLKNEFEKSHEITAVLIEIPKTRNKTGDINFAERILVIK